LDPRHLFADYFEPEATYRIKLANDFPDGSLMLNSIEKLERFGIALVNAKLLMDAKSGPFDMEEFVRTVVNSEMNPTLLLLEWKQGFVVGGFAAVPWPKHESPLAGAYSFATDARTHSFIFSLEPKARRFDLLRADKALLRERNGDRRTFEFGSDLGVCDDGTSVGMCYSR
jgi:hypothetical protein